jgi:protein-tyrosine phosphatase
MKTGIDRRALGLLAGASAASVLSINSAQSTTQTAPNAARAGSPLASVTRKSAQTVRVSWPDASRPTVLVSTDPNAPANFMRALVERGRGNGADFEFAATPRPYFMLKSPVGETRLAERVLPLEGGRNFRDLGGYTGASGRSVKWGQLFRSGVMTNLTANDLTYLSKLGIETVCDLRTAEEINAEPNPMKNPENGAANYVTFTYDLGRSIEPIMRARTRDDAVQAFSAGYMQMCISLAPNYRDMFERLARREVPLAINCTAGKDRTGVGSALILSVLGVSRDEVIADYALTQTIVPPEKYMEDMRNPNSSGNAAMGDRARAFAALPMPVLRVLMGSDPDVMRLTLAQIDREHGSVVAFAKTAFGLTDPLIDVLRSHYLST